MSKQIPLATITTLILSACCSTLSQGATSLNVPNAASAPLESQTIASSIPSVPVAPSIMPSAASSVTPSVSPAAERMPSPASAPHATQPLTKVIKPVEKRAAHPVKKVAPLVTIKPSKSTAKTPSHPTTARTHTVEHSAAQNAPFNRPYVAFGEQFTPIQNAANFRQRGEATWYGKSHQGLPTVNGEIYDVYGMTAAHPTLPIPSYAKVINMSNHKSVVVRINDRGPFDYNKKIIELSFSAANKLGMVGSNNRQVEIVGLESEMPVSSAKHKSPIAFNFAPERANKKSTTKPTAKIPAKTPTQSSHRIQAGIYLQLGAFKTADAAQKFMQKMRTQLGNVAYPLSNGLQDKLQRVRLGPYPNADEARRAAEEMVKPLGFKPLVKQVS